MKKVSAMGARVALLFGLAFYIFMTFIYTEHGIHFVHLWGIEFVLNVIIMYGVSHFFPRPNSNEAADVGAVEMTSWKYTTPMSLALCAVTLLIYVVLGNAG
jgi:SSS family solute:Na+ symporter